MPPQLFPFSPVPVAIADITSKSAFEAAWSPNPTASITMPSERSWSATPPSRQMPSVARLIISSTPAWVPRSTSGAYGLEPARGE
ncbi:hypothetical protein C1Y40_03201 [Mycobacterium talmoniae]|uniref:Uncharacterized protein n=1 Tax=Mycobacterium talmoniae TaxID=1858794 RepID=A0A2S8BIX1_9MYCO|nr:hypothetical protein C1Y40_03201 [Mycobacterium talmoniae]